MDPTAEDMAALAARYGVRDLYVFGSRAQEISKRVRRGGSAPSAPLDSSSDVDVAVQPVAGHELEPRERVRLADELERLFDVRRVDLVVLGEAGPFLAAEVIGGDLLHTSDPRAQAEHELYILRRAADLAPFQRERVRMILNEGAR